MNKTRNVVHPALHPDHIVADATIYGMRVVIVEQNDQFFAFAFDADDDEWFLIDRESTFLPALNLAIEFVTESQCLDYPNEAF